MHMNPYEEWISIYNDDIKSIWEEERIELRKISMIYYAFQNELNKLKNSLNCEMIEIKRKLKRQDCLQKCKKFMGLAQSERFEDKTEISKENCPSPEYANENIESTSPSIHKYSSGKKKKATSPSMVFYPVLTHKICESPNMQRKSDEFQTPKSANDSNIMECSIIENTPDVNPLKKSKNKMSLSKYNTSKKTRHPQKSQKTTLTQMFLEDKVKKKGEIHQTGPLMSISTMINIINQSSDSETDAELDKSDAAIDNHVVNSNKPPKNDLESFIECYDRALEKKNDKSPNFIYNKPMRGNERKKLKGWSCQECETYYKGLNLPPDELEKRKDVCSRHRHKFQPRDETYKGFWDLSFGPTPKTQDSEKSVVFNYKKL